MDINDARAKIDSIDAEIKNLLMQRLDYSEQIAHIKINEGNLTIFRADREEEILNRLGAGVPEERRAGYLAGDEPNVPVRNYV